MKGLLGLPRKDADQRCRPVTLPELRERMVTADVGPFRVTGLDVAVESLTRVMNQVHEHEPDLFHRLGTAGMLCCRYVRGSTRRLSNHSWGTAIDLSISGQLNSVGAETVQRGLLKLYYHFHKEGWYWGAGFRRRDAMHFELADETIKQLIIKP
jgi:hypothetical protein